MTQMTIALALVLGILGAGCDEGSRSEPDAPSSAAFNLSPEAPSGRSYGSLRVVSDGDDSEVCWRVKLETPPKALQLHQDLTGPSDPVVLSLYEPPDDPKLAGCLPFDGDLARRVHREPEGFYVDGHNSDNNPTPVIWAILEPDAS